jgi:hypothetical protein
VKYFDLFDDMSIPGRWALRSPVDERGQRIDPWQFDEGRPLSMKGPLTLPLARPGRALDFTSTGHAVPIVSEKVADLLRRLDLLKQAQLLPARVEGQSGPFFILNVLRVIRCIDDARCREVRHWTPEDGQPEKVGEYRVVSGLRIDASTVGDAHIFRPWGWRVAIIISGHLKQAMEQQGVTGADYTEV